MTLLIQNGVMKITRSDGKTIFNSDDKLLHITNVISGSISIPELNGGNIYGGNNAPLVVNSTTEYDLGAVNSAATQVIGAVKFVVTTGQGGLAFNRWTMVMGGTVIWVMDGAPSQTSLNGASNLGCSQYVSYHFDISAGRARMIRRAIINTAFSYQVRAHTIEYKLRAGVWV